MNIIFLRETMYLTDPSCRLHEMGSWHPESPQRLDAIADQLLVSGLAPFLAERDAPAATREAILRVHTAGHLDSLRARSPRSEEHTSELQSLMRNSYAAFCMKKKKNK